MLYEEMILGSLKAEQGFGALMVDGKTCALGAAYDYRGANLAKIMSGFIEWDLATVYPFLTSIKRCPGCRINDIAIAIITHLNDHHRWSRPQIAMEFVRPIEEAILAEKEKEEEERKAAVLGVEVEAK